METAATGGDPDFTGDTMAIDDDLAAIVEFEFKHSASDDFKIDVGTFQRHFDLLENLISQGIEFFVIHRVLTSRSSQTATETMSRIAAVLIILSLAACGMKGPLELPPKGGAADGSTAQRSPAR